MNIINLILDLNKCKTICFLCLKNQNNTSSVYSVLEVIGDRFNFNMTLANMVKNLFPSHEILFDQACKDCTDLILKMYVTLYTYKRNKTVINFIVDNFDKELQDIKPPSIGKAFIRITTPEYKEIIKEKNSTYLSNVEYNTSDFTISEIGFNYKDLLQEHKTLHKNTNKATVCDTCGQEFKTPNSLKAHLNCHKEKECPYCFKVLKSHSHYNVHIKRHKSGVKRKRNKLYYNCNECSYQTLNKNTLEAHINKIHLHIRPYVCQTCYKGFYKKSHLTEHSNTHSQSKNKTCEICGDNFVNQKTLTEHQRLHSDMKPYECHICTKKFVTSGRRSDHIKRSHMEKTEHCIFCEKKFSLKNELNRHMKKIHTENIIPIGNIFEMNISNYRFDQTGVSPIT